jgi:hypothetical protein
MFMRFRFYTMVFNGTFNNISAVLWRSVLLVEEFRVSSEKPPTCHKSLTNFITQGMAIPCYERLWSSCGSLKGYSNIVVQKHVRCSIVFGYSIYVKPHIVLPKKWRKYIIWLGFTSPLIIDVPIPNKESERSCLWGSDFTPASTSFQLEFGTVPAVIE